MTMPKLEYSRILFTSRMLALDLAIRAPASLKAMIFRESGSIMISEITAILPPAWTLRIGAPIKEKHRLT